MAELLKQQHSLAVLVLSLARSRTSVSALGDAVFKLEVSGETRFVQTFDTAAEIGLPSTLREARSFAYRDPSYRIPEPAVRALQQELRDLQSQGIPLWLQFVSPSGNLPLVPWERLLQPRLNIPILRLPYFSLKPFSASSRLDVAIVASQAAKALIDIVPMLMRMVPRLLEAIPRDEVVLHVFVDADLYEATASALQAYDTPAGGRQLRVYDSRTMTSDSLGERSNPAEALESAWLRWIKRALHDQSVDVVHFLCHGYLSLDAGALALADWSTSSFPPTESAVQSGRSTQLIDASLLTTFLTQIGAWSAGFSSPAPNYSSGGTRLLADQLARTRPGPVLIHDLFDDPGLTALGEAFGFLYTDLGNIQRAAPETLAVGLYCHPSYTKEFAETQEDSAQTALLDTYTLAQGPTRDMLQSRDNTPSWIASSQRYLEQSIADVFRDEPGAGGPPSAFRQGTEDALKFVADAVRRHAAEASISNGDGGPQ